jgi:putative glutamine amidotransferase
MIGTHMRRPVIGISASWYVDQASHGTFNRHAISADYSLGVAKAGGAPIILPFIPDVVDTFLDLVDGLILSGGSDFDPARFGDAEVHPATYDILPDRDEAEIRLIQGAMARDIPILGICRGIQAIAIATGGTLIQDVATQYSPEIGHRQHERAIAADQPGHQIKITPGTCVAAIYGGTATGVNSFHHQAVKDVPDGFVVSARSDDGLIEAIEKSDGGFVVGLQWHPELMFATHPQHLRPFEAIVDAARARKLSLARN